MENKENKLSLEEYKIQVWKCLQNVHLTDKLDASSLQDLRSEAYVIATSAKKYASVASKAHQKQAIVNAATTSLNEARSARLTKQRAFEASFCPLAYINEQTGEEKVYQPTNYSESVLNGIIRTEIFEALEELYEGIRLTVAELPEVEQNLAELAMSDEDLTQEQIAECFGVTARTIRNRYAALAPHFEAIYNEMKALRAELN